MRRTVALDLDGVLATYNGFHAAIGAPLPGSAAFLRRLSALGWDAVLHTCRDAADVDPWLREHGLRLPVATGKPIASAYLDDRAVRFTGDWADALRDLEALRPWWKAP